VRSKLLGLLLAGIALMGMAVTAADPNPPIITSLPYIEFQTTGEAHWMFDLDWRPDGEVLAVTIGNDIALFNRDLREVERLTGHTDTVFAVSWNADGTRLASGGDDATIRVWDMVEGSPSYATTVQTFQESNRVAYLKWPPNLSEPLIAALINDQIIAGSDEAILGRVIHIWNVQTNQLSASFGPAYSSSREVIWSPDGTQIALAGIFDYPDYSLKVWNISTSQIVAELNNFPQRIGSIAWRSNPSQLIAASDFLFVNDATTPNLEFVTRIEEFVLVHSVALSPSEQLFALVDEDYRLVIGEIDTGANLVEITDLANEGASRVAWHPTGIWLASLNGFTNLRLWDISAIPPSGLPTLTPYPTATPFGTPAPTDVLGG
jgi:WD40 repeat protein